MLHFIEIGTNEGIELGFWDGKVLGTTLGELDKLSLGKYEGIQLEYLEGYTDGAAYGKLEVLLQGA